MRSPWLIEVIPEEFESIPLVSSAAMRITFEAKLDQISTFEVSRASILSTFEAKLDQIPMFEYSRFVIRVTSEGVVPLPDPPDSAAHTGTPPAETFKTCPAVALTVRVCNVLSADAYMRSP